MTLLSIIIPAIKGYLDARDGGLIFGRGRGGQKMCLTLLFWFLVVVGSFFAFSGLYEYFNSIYTPVFAKGYMAGACFALSIGGWALSWLVKRIASFFQRSTAPTVDSHTIEEQVAHIVKVIQTDGVQLIQKHPLAALLVGVSVGLLSGIVPLTKKK